MVAYGKLWVSWRSATFDGGRAGTVLSVSPMILMTCWYGFSTLGSRWCRLLPPKVFMPAVAFDLV